MHIKNPRLFRAFAASIAVAVVMGTSGRADAQSQSFQTPYVTRAEAAMLLLLARIPNVPPLVSNGEFPDVPKGAWYERYIVAAERLGILQGHAVTNRIRPEDPVTRAEFTSMAAKTFGINTFLFFVSYSDVPQESWYAPGAGMAQHLHLFPADADQTTFKPEEFMIHSEMAKAVQLLSDAIATREGLKRTALTQQQSSNRNISTNTQRVSLIKPRGAAPNIVSYTQVTPAGSSPSQISRLRLEVLALVNAERAKVGLSPLRTNTTLQASAQEYALDMVEQDFFSHVSPSGESLKDRMERSGYYKPFFQSDCLCVARFVMGENLARGQKTAKEVVRDWMASPAHREAIVNAGFTDTGIGVVAGLWVEHFGGKQK